MFEPAAAAAPAPAGPEGRRSPNRSGRRTGGGCAIRSGFARRPRSRPPPGPSGRGSRRPTRRAGPARPGPEARTSGVSPLQPEEDRLRSRPRARRAIPRPAALPRPAPDRGSTAEAAAPLRLDGQLGELRLVEPKMVGAVERRAGKAGPKAHAASPPFDPARRRPGEQGRQAGLVEPLDRPPGRALASVDPARRGRAEQAKVEREMGEDMIDRPRLGPVGRGRRAFAGRRGARSRRRSEGRAFRRAGPWPGGGRAGRGRHARANRRCRCRRGLAAFAALTRIDLPAALPSGPRSGRRAGSGRNPATRGVQIVEPRSIIAWAKSPAPLVRRDRCRRARRSRSRAPGSGSLRPRTAARRPARHWRRPPPPFGRRRSRRSPRRCSGRCPEACATPPRSSGKRPSCSRATCLAQAIRLRARA